MKRNGGIYLMKKANGVIIGSLFILVGLLYAGSALNLFEFTIFFPGWWTLFIIVPCLYALTRAKEDKAVPLVGLLIGICLLINAQNFGFHIEFFPMAIAVVCILIGWKLIFPQKKSQQSVEYTYNSATGETKTTQEASTDETTSDTRKASGFITVNAVFGGKDVCVDNECFTGADINVVLGGVDLNLKNAIISEDVYINVSSVLGGVDIFVPANVRVVTDGCSTLLGGIDINNSYANFHDADSPKLIIKGNCVLGGIDIK